MKREWMLLHPIQIDHSTNAKSHAFTLISTLLFTYTSSCFKQTVNLHVTINIRSQRNSRFLLKWNFFQWMHATEKNTNWICPMARRFQRFTQPNEMKRIKKTYAEKWTKKRANVNENKIREYSLITRNNCFQIIVSLRVQMHGAPTMQTRKKPNIEMNWIGQKSGAAIRKKPMWTFDAIVWEKKEENWH